MNACLVPCVEPTCRGYEHGSSSRWRRASNIGLSCSINSSAKRTNTKPGGLLRKEPYKTKQFVFVFIVPIFCFPERVCLRRIFTLLLLVHTFSRTRVNFVDAGMIGDERDGWTKIHYQNIHRRSRATSPMQWIQWNTLTNNTNTLHEPVHQCIAWTLMQYDQTLRAQHMLHSRQCTLHMDIHTSMCKIQ